MSCTKFQQDLKSGALTSEALQHLRSCPGCLEAAVAADPENLFRSLGGEMDPPGGIDDFVAEVMHEIQLRTTEQALGRRQRFGSASRWGVAAALAIAIASVALIRDDNSKVTTAIQQPPAATVTTTVPASLPVVESYEEAGAMIVEVPALESDDIKVVMIFDETLPVDL